MTPQITDKQINRTFTSHSQQKSSNIFSLCPIRGSMSLFKARDWWSAALGEGEEFDQGCLCVGDVDNSGTGHGQYIVKNRCTQTA